MNGDTYSSRGRLVIISHFSHETNEWTIADSGRSRDNYVRTTSQTLHAYSGTDKFEQSSRGDRGDDRRDRDRGDRGDRDRHRERDRGERRRSRSPHGRSRRDEVDSYSSSRDYRAREREDRYGGPGRRDEREWDRDRGDRGGRRDDRRGQEERPRRDRDLFDDRRGGGGGGGGRAGRDRDPFRQEEARQPKRSASPPPKKKEPTPDLTDIVPILERRRRLTQWDIKPPGYENVTAEQAKLSGMFPLPGAPRQQPMDPSKLKAFMDQPAGTVSNAALKPSNARQSKRLFAYNIPSSATETTIVDFFNLQLNGLNVTQGYDPCISAQISKDRSFVLCEFKSPLDATVALAFDGIAMEEHDAMQNNGESNGSAKGLSIRRPKDYIVPTSDETEHMEGVVSSDVPDTANKICVSHIPLYLTDEQVTELLVSFGVLKAFILVRDNGTQESRGIAFCEYADPASTSIAVEGLHGMELGEQALKVTRASIGYTQAAGLETGVQAMSMFAGTTSTDLEESRVLQLLNMVTPEELIDNEDYEEICEDIQEECSKYGEILEMKIPRPSGGSRQSAGVGKIYLKYDTNESAKKALQNLAGRKFADRTVVTTYFSEVSRALSLILAMLMLSLQESFEVNAW